MHQRGCQDIMLELPIILGSLTTYPLNFSLSTNSCFHIMIIFGVFIRSVFVRVRERMLGRESLW